MRILKIPALVFCLSSSMVMAADEDRSGLLVGLAAGSSMGNVSTEGSIGQNVSSDMEASGGAFSFKLGGSVGNKGAVYFLTQGSSSSEDQVHSLTGIGGVYYFKKSGASIYLNGGFGFGGVSYSDDTVSPSIGKAATAGIGIELGMGLNFEVNYLKVETQFDENVNNPGPQLDYNIATTQFMIGYTWF